MTKEKKEQPNNAQPDIKSELINEIKRLALMDTVEYEITRDEVAKKFDIRIAMLDEFVGEERRKINPQKNETILFPVVTLCAEPVNLTELLNDINQILSKFVVFQSEHEPRAIALWIVHTHVFDAFDLTPFLFISSPEKQCGKSTLLDLIQELVFNRLVATNLTPAAFFRSIEMYKPTLLIEEVDAFMRENEELRGVVNGSNRRSLSFVLRCVGDPPEPKQFNTYCPKVFCGIGKLPETIEDRAVIIRLNRKTIKEKKEKRRLRNKDQQKTFYNLRSKCARFAQDNIEQLKALDYEKEVEPQMPACLDSRAMDNWEPLLAIASLANENWIKHAKDAAIFLSGTKKEVISIGTELLADIQNIFDARKTERMFSKDLLEQLNKIDESPWPTFYHGKPMTARQLGSRLNDYQIKSKDIRIGNNKAKGFDRHQFEDSWQRYLSDEETHTQVPPDFAETSETARQASNDAGSSPSDILLPRMENRDTKPDLANVSVPQARQTKTVSDKKTLQPSNDAGCLAVSDKHLILKGINEDISCVEV